MRLVWPGIPCTVLVAAAELVVIALRSEVSFGELELRPSMPLLMLRLKSSSSLCF